MLSEAGIGPSLTGVSEQKTGATWSVKGVPHPQTHGCSHSPTTGIPYSLTPTPNPNNSLQHMVEATGTRLP